MATDKTGLEHEPQATAPQGRLAHEAAPPDFMALDDTALLAWRAEARAELERLPSASPDHAVLSVHYDESTAEVNDRARRAWSRGN